MRLTIYMGRIQCGEPTNRWSQGADGGWREEWTPTQRLDHEGHCYREEPFESLIAMFSPRAREFIRAAGGVIVESAQTLEAQR